MQIKLPAFQFYPGDWRKNVGVQSLDYHSRGVWFELLCLMHESDRRGVLLLGGKPMPTPALANLLGLSVTETQRALRKIEKHGVCGRDAKTGAITCRRMIKDEKLRQVRAKSGFLGGTERGARQTASKPQATRGQTAKQKATPSASSSVSVSSSSPPSSPSASRPVSPLPPPTGGEPQESGEKDRGIGGCPPEQQELMQALAAIDGSNPAEVPPSAWHGIARALKDIQAVCPGLSVEEIQRRGNNYRTHMPTARITPRALAKFWALCANPNQARPDEPTGGRASFA